MRKYGQENFSFEILEECNKEELCDECVCDDDFKTEEELDDAINSLLMGMPIDLACVDIKNCWISLGEILGEVSSEDLIDELFARFCLGK